MPLGVFFLSGYIDKELIDMAYFSSKMYWNVSGFFMKTCIFWRSLESPLQGTVEYPQHMSTWRNKKNILLIKLTYFLFLH